MAVDSKSKGNKFERDIAKKLSTWYYDDSSALVRNATSGALSTIRTNAGLPSGDIQQVKYLETKPFPYSVECKHHKEFKLEHLVFIKPKSKVFKAWCQCKRDAKKDNKIPLLIFRANYQATYCALDLEAFSPKVVSLILSSSKHYCVTELVLVVDLEYFLSDPVITKFFEEFYPLYKDKDNE